MAAEIT